MWLHRVKHRLHEILHSNEDFKEEDFSKVCLHVHLSTDAYVGGTVASWLVHLSPD